MTLNALVVLPAVIATAYGTVYGLIAAPLAAKWVMERVLPFAVGGAYLGAALGLGLVHGAWRWTTGSLELEEEELGRAITRRVKSEKPCDGQLEEWPEKQGPTIDVDLADDLETIKRTIENALS